MTLREPLLRSSSAAEYRMVVAIFLRWLGSLLRGFSLASVLRIAPDVALFAFAFWSLAFSWQKATPSRRSNLSQTKD